LIFALSLRGIIQLFIISFFVFIFLFDFFDGIVFDKCVVLNPGVVRFGTPALFALVAESVAFAVSAESFIAFYVVLLEE